jgi:hypothetical protein
LKMEAVNSSETSVDFYKTSCDHVPVVTGVSSRDPASSYLPSMVMSVEWMERSNSSHCADENLASNEDNYNAVYYIYVAKTWGLILVWCILLRLCLTKITSQLPLFAAYLVFTVHNIIPHYMFRLYGHPQVCHIYKKC